MVNHEIVEGLRTALARGYSLQQAMISFFNAGYKKEDIEEAARALYTHPSQPLSHPGKPTPEEVKKPVSHKTQPIQTHQAAQQMQPAQTSEKPKPKKFPKPAFQMPEEEKEAIKKEAAEEKEEKKPVTKPDVSKYEEKTKPRGKLITILLIILLFVLVSALVGIFLFKEQLISFFTGLFG